MSATKVQKFRLREQIIAELKGSYPLSEITAQP